MITEDYVSFEIAKLLKEKGFNVPCCRRYKGDSMVTQSALYSTPFYQEEKSSEYVLCPTHQMAMKWLREVHGIFISVICGTYPTLNKVTWTPDITTFESVFPDNAIECNTYEEACEAAIKYSLENLI